MRPLLVFHVFSDLEIRLPEVHLFPDGSFYTWSEIFNFNVTELIGPQQFECRHGPAKPMSAIDLLLLPHPKAMLKPQYPLSPCTLQMRELRPKNLRDIQDHLANQWQSQSLNPCLLTSGFFTVYVWVFGGPRTPWLCTATEMSGICHCGSRDIPSDA